MGERFLWFPEDEALELRRRLEKRFHARTKEGCLVRPGSQTDYPRITWRGKSYSAHRVSYAVWKGAVPIRWYVCHLCSNPKCVNPTHLRLGTAQQNSADNQRKTKDIERPEGVRGPLSEPVCSTEGFSWPPPPPEPDSIPPLLAMAFPAAFPEPQVPRAPQPPNRDLEKLAFPGSFKDEE